MIAMLVVRDALQYAQQTAPDETAGGEAAKLASIGARNDETALELSLCTGTPPFVIVVT